MKYSKAVLVLHLRIFMSINTAIKFNKNNQAHNIYCMNINRAIRFLRKQRGWTQQQLADFSNTSKSNISNIENGNQGYSEAVLQYLANAFGCPVSSIFLLAEHLERQQNNTSKSLEEMPVELIFLQLPIPLRQSFKSLMIQTLEQLSK